MSLSDQPWIDRFLDVLWLEYGLSDNTLSAYRKDLELFGSWLETKSLSCLYVPERDILSYLSHLLNAGSKASAPARRLSCLRRFYRFLKQQRGVALNPTLNVDLPKLPRLLLKSMGEDQVLRLLGAPDAALPLGAVIEPCLN